MTQVELIRAEIDRLYNSPAPKHDQQCDFEDGYFTGISKIDDFLDTLQEPKNAEDYHKAFDELYGEHIPNLQEPEVDLEKELDAWRHSHFNGKRDGHYSGEYMERSSQLDLARHFHELRKNTK